ncbi:MAG: glycosyltransferase, partial [Acidobacteriales bacterium]|nr:glycosyltransferase [Terriglobales bacterium]
MPLRIRIFAHSWISDWNHGNAHFLRGLASELLQLGHDVRCYEEKEPWSRTNLREEGPLGEQAEADFHAAFPELDIRPYETDGRLEAFLELELREADLVVVHEWTPPELSEKVLDLRDRSGFLAVFLDTHHRAYTSPEQILRFPLSRFDGVLAFGKAIRTIYRDGFGVQRVWTFHEAADVAHFHPTTAAKDTDVVWVGNWGDEERTRELQEFLIDPAASLRDKKFAVHGVRYPEQAREQLAQAGIAYRGYLPNLSAPSAYGRSRLSLHVPRRFYANGLSGVPTIRVFEALACGTPLVCSPWSDAEGLFRPGEDYVVVEDGSRMREQIEWLLG